MNPSKLPDQFYIDLAVGTSPYGDICDIHDIPEEDRHLLEEDQEFQRRLKIARQVVEDDGTAFRARCRTLVHRAIPNMEFLIANPDTPAATRLETFKALVKYGNLEPEKKEGNTAAGPNLVLNIIAPDGQIGFQAEAKPVLEVPKAIVNESAPSKEIANEFYL